MPGGRSLGCKICKQRKIKCDERHPICTQCEKRNRTCKGVLTPFVYEYWVAKAETADQSQRRRSKAFQRGIRRRPVVQAESISQKSSRTKIQERNISRCRSEEASRSDLAVSVPYRQSEDLAARAFQVLEANACKGNDILVFAEYLPELLTRISCNSALDTALEALLLSHRNKMLDVHELNDGAEPELYGRALLALSEHIDASDRYHPSHSSFGLKLG